MEAFRWTRADGMVGLGDLPGGRFNSQAHGVSADGAVIVGESEIASAGPRFPPARNEAFRWTQADGMVGLGDLEGGNFQSKAYDVSGDGSVVVGSSHTAHGNQAFRWTLDAGMIGLGDLPGGFTSAATAITPDGSAVAGYGNIESSTIAFRWTQTGGIVGLGNLPGGGSPNYAYDVSADGLTVIGDGSTTESSEAFRWTETSGMVGLGDLPGGYYLSGAKGISADGSVVVGLSWTASDAEAYIWDAAHGMRSLKDVLANDGLGASLTGWTLISAQGISADGRVVVGLGTNPDGDAEAWIAGLAAIPEPASLILSVIGLPLLNVLRTRTRLGRRAIAKS
jgi:probable HAF family extracellular repeat protein